MVEIFCLYLNILHMTSCKQLNYAKVKQVLKSYSCSMQSSHKATGATVVLDNLHLFLGM